MHVSLGDTPKNINVGNKKWFEVINFVENFFCSSELVRKDWIDLKFVNLLTFSGI